MLNTAANIKPPQGDDLATTPGDLRAMRQLLGMSQEQVGKLIGAGPGDVRTLESGRTHFLYRGHAAILEGMLARVNALLDANLAENTVPPKFLFSYPNDGAFLDYEPKLAWMEYASVHSMYLARLLDEWRMRGHRPTIVGIVPLQYSEEWLKGQKDTLERREAWAEQHLKVISYREGLPGDRKGKP